MVLLSLTVCAVCAQAGVTAPAAPCAAREDAYRAEIYGPRSVAHEYAVTEASNLPGPARRAADMGTSLLGHVRAALGEYFAQDYVSEAATMEARFCAPTLHFEGPGYFEAAKKIAGAQEVVRRQFATLLASQCALARVVVRRDSLQHFAQAFEIADGLEGFANVDQLRIRSVPVEPVLAAAGYRHGARVAADTPRLVGFSETNTVIEIALPLVEDGTYLADVTFTFYKAVEAEEAAGMARGE